MNIDPKMLRAIDDYPVIRQYLDNIPQNVWDLLLPDSEDDLAEFSSDIRSCWDQGEERDFIMKVQVEHGLPLRPNASVRDTVIAVRIEHLRKKHRHSKNQPPHEEGSSIEGDNGQEFA